MDTDRLLRTLRFRIRRAEHGPAPLFPSACLHVLQHIQRYDRLAGVMRRTCTGSWGFEEEVQRLASEALTLPHSLAVTRHTADSFDEQIALLLTVLEHVAGAAHADFEAAAFLVRTMEELLTGQESDEYEDALDTVRELLLGDLDDFFEERLESDSELLDLLDNYRIRVEKTRRARTVAIATDGLEGRQGAAAIAVDLAEWLADCGQYRAVFAADEVADAAPRADVAIAWLQQASGAVDQVKRAVHATLGHLAEHDRKTGALVVVCTGKTAPRFALPNVEGRPGVEVDGRTLYVVPVMLAESAGDVVIDGKTLH